MDHQECERILYIILSGKQFIEVDEKVFLVTSPNVDVTNEANYIYQKTLKKSNSSYSKSDLHKMLIGRGYFSLSDLDFLEKFPENLKKLQKQLYYTRNNLSRQKAIKESLAFLRSEYDRIYSIVSEYDSYTQEGLAGYAKTLFTLSKTCYYKNKLVRYSKSLFDKILSEIYRNSVTVNQIRYIARHNPWANMWIGLKNNGKIFENGVSLSVEQQGLLMWTRIYESIQECAEPPEKNVVEDDDMFDGWMASQGEDKKKEEKDHQEIFVVAETQEDIDRIHNMNSASSQQIKNQRLDYVYNKGTVRDIDLPDLAQELAMQSVREGIEKQRGK